MTVSRVEGLDRLMRKFTKMADANLAHKAVLMYAKDVESEVTPYPPETEANQPPTPYYDRGVGMVTGTSAHRTSEDMLHKWMVHDTSPILLENTASYSGWLSGLHQVAWAGARGWKVAKVLAVQNLGRLKRIFHTIFEDTWR